MQFGRFKNIFHVVISFLIIGLLGFIIYQSIYLSDKRTKVVVSVILGTLILIIYQFQYWSTGPSQNNGSSEGGSSNFDNINRYVTVEQEDNSNYTIQRPIFRNLEQKIEYLRDEICTRYRSQLFDQCEIDVTRDTILKDSMNVILSLSPESLRLPLYVVFLGELGSDSGGLTKEWLELIIQEAMNPDLGYFQYTNENNTTVRPFIFSDIEPNHLNFYEFIGRILGMAIINKCNVGAYFERSVFKSLLNIKCSLSDLEEVDSVYYNSLVSIRDHPIKELDLGLSFDHEINALGDTKTIDLIPNGRNIDVTDENKNQYINLKVQMILHDNIKAQLNALKDGLYAVIDFDLISIFTDVELELLICGTSIIDIKDWKNNTVYSKFDENSDQIQWFWRAVEEFSETERTKLLQFVTGASRVPVGGFANLQSRRNEKKFKIIKSCGDILDLPSAHTCFNQLVLPNYPTYEILKNKILLAINEGSEGFELS